MAKKDKHTVCPERGSDALYNYGRVNDLLRLQCISCGHQFIPGHERKPLQNRPNCPECGNTMHLYRSEQDCIRFRCSTYPDCRMYIKLSKLEMAEHRILCE